MRYSLDEYQLPVALNLRSRMSRRFVPSFRHLDFRSYTYGINGRSNGRSELMFKSRYFRHRSLMNVSEEYKEDLFDYSDLDENLTMTLENYYMDDDL